MSEPQLSLPGRTTRLTPVQWVICIVAIIGFAFDIYELLMLPLIVRPALLELAGPGVVPGTDEFAEHVGQLFYLPAVCGGLFGLMGGWLIDRLGRRRVLVWSVMIYSVSPLGAAFSTTVGQLLFFRCTTFIGVSVEFVAAVAWLAELFPEPTQREKVLGFTQAFSSFGGLMIAAVNGLIVIYADHFPAIGNVLGSIADPHAPWRYTLISGLIPAIPIMVLLPFLPESPMWLKKRAEGTLKRPSILAVFSPELRRTTIVTTLMFAMSYGAAFGSLQALPRIVPGIPEVKQEIDEKTKDVSEKKDQKRIRGLTVQARAAKLAKVQEVGGLYGRVWMALLLFVLLAGGTASLLSSVLWSQLVVFLLLESLAGFQGGFTDHLQMLGIGVVAGAVAGVAMWGIGLGLKNVLKRITARNVIRLFQLPGIVLMPIIFGYIATRNLTYLYYGVFIAGFLTVGQFTFWGNYLPRVYPLHLRGTGQSFAANIGGRMIGTCFAWVSAKLAVLDFMPGESHPVKLAVAAGVVGFAVYAVGFVASFWLPEPETAELPD